MGFTIAAYGACSRLVVFIDYEPRQRGVVRFGTDLSRRKPKRSEKEARLAFWSAVGKRTRALGLLAAICCAATARVRAERAARAARADGMPHSLHARKHASSIRLGMLIS